MKLIYKICLIVIFLIIMLLCCENTRCAEINVDDYDLGEIDASNYESAKEPIQKIIKILRIIAIIVAGVGISLLGFKYMLGSFSEKAQYKETMLPFIFGAVFVFSVSFVLQIISNINTIGN